ncbi:DinB family protein [Paenibacillus eucommiae]|uniref:Catechol 2,3-dioxygenase-like lactoylglutathione lyase family enzyme n=1 Tax=Paenibacillus eucommiae TaxID=1355755 RepID=A0ABS4IXJ4_9BACL|nr:DinB family protein [Paenibacillus eucommiae]MBP1992304.1 catechol 2,3-dioxygenase-like lactoylglutathione lyase family enzyme [Paenibacillus eucommiae]
MSSHKAALLLRVKSVSDSVQFYTKHLGWVLVELEGFAESGGAIGANGANRAIGALGAMGSTGSNESNGLEVSVQPEESESAALMEIIPGYKVVLAGTQPPVQWLGEVIHSPQPQDRFYVGVQSIEVIKQLLERGEASFHIAEDPGFIRELLVSTPDGYTAVYWEELYLASGEIVSLYGQGARELKEALTGLDEKSLDLSLDNGKWSIRQHVLHLIDLELVTIHKVKFALAEPGKQVEGVPFSQDVWSEGLAYASRSIGLEVEMFALLREHILGMCNCLPDALKRYVRSSGMDVTVSQLLKMMAGHSRHHVRTIRQIRAKHDV